jgi:hypothetical protein
MWQITRKIYNPDSPPLLPPVDLERKKYRVKAANYIGEIHLEIGLALSMEGYNSAAAI